MANFSHRGTGCAWKVCQLRDQVILIHGRAWSRNHRIWQWRVPDIENWKVVLTLRGRIADVLGSTFFRRLRWSPCGHFITTTHGFQKPRHSAPVLERVEWSATFDFLGHNAPIIVVNFNHSMFRRNISNAQEVKSVHVEWTNWYLQDWKKRVAALQYYCHW